MIPAAAVKAVHHELNEVEALTDFSERGAREICEAVVRVVLEAMAPSVAPECICGHPQLAHEDDVGFCWDCDACEADPACREFVERVLKDGPVAHDGGVCACETPGDWHRVANDFQRAMFREAAKAKAYRAALEELRKAGGALYPAASEVENAGDFDVAPLGCAIGWLKALDTYHAVLGEVSLSQQDRYRCVAEEDMEVE